jgi:predicted transcriptional regulator
MIFGKSNKYYEIDLKFIIKVVTINPDTSKLVDFIVENLGNQKATIELLVASEYLGDIKPTLETKLINLKARENVTLSLNVIILKDAQEKVFNITLKAIVQESTIITSEDVLVVIIKKDYVEADETSKNQTLNLDLILFLLMAIIILLITLFLYTKIKRHRLLEHERREMIYKHIKDHPGDHFRAIMNALNLEVGSLSHHVNKLEGEGLIKSRQDGMYRRFYTIDAKIDGRLVLSELQERILNFIKSNPGIAGSKIANNFGMDRKLITYHVGVLEKIGIIYVEHKGRDLLCYSVSGV